MPIKTKINVTPGLNLLSVLGIIFVVLKLTDHIDWSWWWVTVPFWGPPAIVLTTLAGIFICVAVLTAMSDK